MQSLGFASARIIVCERQDEYIEKGHCWQEKTSVLRVQSKSKENVTNPLQLEIL